MLNTINKQTRICITLLFALLLPSGVAALNFDFGKIKETATKIKRATGKISVKEEVEIGGLITSNLLGAAPLVDDPELQRYVNRVGMWVAQQSERPDLPWRFGVIKSDNVNAFAAPGGYIILTHGLFATLNSEAELAGVLGHEIAHVNEKHHLNALKKSARMDLLGDALQASAKDKSRSDRKKLGKLINAGTQLYARGLDRKYEYDADRIGVVYAARAGYDPYALFDVLTTLDSIKADSPTMALLLSTHPPFSERLEKLDSATEGHLDAYATQPVLQDRLLALQLKLLANQNKTKSK